MLDSLLWNVVLTTALAIVLTALSYFSWMQRRPALRQWLWLFVLAKLVTPPMFAVPLLPAAMPVESPSPVLSTTGEPTGLWRDVRKRFSQFEVTNNATNAAASVPAAVVVSPVEVRSGWQVSIEIGLMAVSLIGSVALLLFHIMRAVDFRRWLQRAGAADPQLTVACEDVRAKLNLRANVDNLAVEARITPLLWAWLRPLVVVPRQLIDELDAEQLRSIVTHELAHYIRRDHWANAFALVVKALWWWNPVVWWADRQQRMAQELCCDAVAVHRGSTSRREYGTTLLQALDFVHREPLAASGLAPGLGSRGSTLRRFEMLGEKRLAYRLSRWAPITLLLLGMALLCFPARAENEAVPVATENVEAAFKRVGQHIANGEPVLTKVVLSVFEKLTEKVVGERPRGKCSIHGQVISAETGQPVEGARMYLFYTKTHAAVFEYTQADGTFAFEGIPSGPFSLMVSRASGFQDVAYDPENTPGTYPTFTLADGEQRKGIVLKAKPAYRISGEIRDEKGEVPEDIGELRVLAWTKQKVGDRYRSRNGRVHREGSYTINGLGGEPAYVMVINRRAAREGDARPPIYYPSTFSRSKAKQITFGEEPSVDGVDIVLKRSGGLVLQGKVTDEAGDPVPEVFVVVHRRDMLFDFVTAYTDEQGEYRIEGLGDGEFSVHLDAVQRGFVRRRSDLDLDGQRKTTQLSFTLTEGVEISGRFVDEAGIDWQIGRSDGHAYRPNHGKEWDRSFSLTRFWNKHRPRDVNDSSGGAFAIGEGRYRTSQMLFPTKSTFVIQGMMPGETVLRFSPVKENQEVVQVRWKGRNIKETGFVSRAGEKIEGVEIVIGKR